MKTLIRVLVLKYPHWQSILNNKSICNSTIIEFTYYTCIYTIYMYKCIFEPTSPGEWLARESDWLSPLLFPFIFKMFNSLSINLPLNFSFYLFDASAVKLGCILLPSASAAADCTQDGDPEIILCNIWLQMWGCNLQIPSPKKAGQWLPCLAFMGGESGGMGKIMRGFRHARSVTVSARQKEAGLMHVWMCTKT